MTSSQLFKNYQRTVVLNHGGREVFKVNPEQRFRRFLILGSDGGYYANAKEKTIESAEAALQLLEQAPETYLTILHEVSDGGLALRQQPTLFALALALSDERDEVRAMARALLPEVARTSTHLFTLLNYLKGQRGLGGQGIMGALAGWYINRSANWVATQATKYRQREGWTHRDVLRIAHPKLKLKEPNPALEATLRWIATGKVPDDIPDKIEGYLAAQKPGADLPRLIEKYNLTWEMVPTEAHNDPDVWIALSKKMPPGALMRNLSRFTRLGIIDSTVVKEQIIRLRDPEVMKKGRMHPVQVLLASKAYASGRSKGGETWHPESFVGNVLNDAFYAAYGNVEASGKRELYAVDVSQSMSHPINAENILTSREAAVALALVAKSVSPDLVEVVAFSHAMQNSWLCSTEVRYGYHKPIPLGIAPLDITPQRRLDDAVKYVADLPFGGTDCSLPMVWAEAKGKKFDTFVVLTDNETWAHHMSPADALLSYRKTSGITDAKLVVASMESNDFTIADPGDPGMLDVVGLDPSVPNLIANFSRGRL